MAFGVDDAAMLGLGVVNAGLGMAQQHQEKKAGRRTMALQKQIMARNLKRGKEELGFKEQALRHQDVFDERNINESANERGILDSSIVGDNQNEREYQLNQKLAAMDRARKDMDYEYKMSVEMQRISERLADATNWMSMLQTAIQGGAMGVGAVYGAGK